MLKIGHRGAAGYEPENTLRSFKKALELNVDMIEFDVYICKSGEVVIMHDDKIDRTTNGTGFVFDKTLAELKSLDAGKGEKIPTLEEALNIINCKVPINIELRGKHISKPVSDLIENYVNKKGWSYNNFFVSSFNHSELKYFHQLNDKIKIGYLINLPLFYINPAKKINAYSINPSLKYVNKKLVDNAHKNGFKVFVWTVNEKKDVEKMKILGVDGIFSDYPDKI